MFPHPSNPQTQTRPLLRPVNPRPHHENTPFRAAHILRLTCCEPLVDAGPDPCSNLGTQMKIILSTIVSQPRILLVQCYGWKFGPATSFQNNPKAGFTRAHGCDFSIISTSQTENGALPLSISQSFRTCSTDGAVLLGGVSIQLRRKGTPSDYGNRTWLYEFVYTEE